MSGTMWLPWVVGGIALGWAAGRGRFRFGDVFGLFFEEPQVARFVAVAETAGGVKLPNPSTDFHIPNLHAPGLRDGSLPVIFFRTRHTGRPTFQVRLNSTILTNYTFESDDPQHSWHEIIPAGA